MDKYDLALLLIRAGFGVSMCAHGLNKVFSGNGISGTAGWFGSIGMKWPRAQALAAATSEIVAGALLAVGLFTSLACAVIVSLMLVAIVTVHWRVGYFIFLPNGGWEYCASIIVVAAAVAVTGPGAVSLDDAWGLPALHAGATVGVAVFATVCHLALSWRPPAR